MLNTILLVAVFAAIILMISTLKWPQTSLGLHMVGIMLAVIAVYHMGFQSGVLYTLFGLLLFGMFVFKLKERTPIFPLSPQEVTVLALVMYMVISLLYTTTPNYGKDKIMRFIGVGIPLVFACRLFCTTREHTRQTLNIVAWISAATLFLYIVLFVGARQLLMVEGRYGGGTDPLILGWTAAAAIVFVGYFVIARTMIWTKVFAGVLMLGGMVVIIATGSRGPFLALLMGAGLAFLGRKGLIKSFLFLVLFSGISFAALMYFAPEKGRDRVLSGFDGTYALAKSGRTGLYNMGFEQYLEHALVGGGVGSFASYRGWGDQRSYCHNMIMEIAGEMGTVGLLILFLLFAYSIWPILRLRSKDEPMAAEGKIIQLLFWVGLINAMVSFDIPEQRTLFAAFGFLGAVRQWPRPEEEALADPYANYAWEPNAEYPLLVGSPVEYQQ